MGPNPEGSQHGPVTVTLFRHSYVTETGGPKTREGRQQGSGGRKDFHVLACLPQEPQVPPPVQPPRPPLAPRGALPARGRTRSSSRHSARSMSSRGDADKTPSGGESEESTLRRGILYALGAVEISRRRAVFACGGLSRGASRQRARGRVSRVPCASREPVAGSSRDGARFRRTRARRRGGGDLPSPGPPASR